MVYQKETAMHIWSHNSLILAHMQLQPRKGTSLIVEQSFGVQMICIHCAVFELCLREKKESKQEEQQQRNQNFHIQFSQL